ncbi:MAG: glycosyltransferase family 1 protein [Anaerolineae bacterium]
MHIAIDASRTTVAHVTGTERYALEMIRALLALETPHTFTLYFRDNPLPGLFPSYPQVEQRVIPFRRAWTHLRFAAALAADRPDMVWVPAHTLPVVFPGRAAVTVHDLGYRIFPQAHPSLQRRYLDWSTAHSARRAAVVFADSQATARDLAQFYGTRSDKVRVVYPGVDIPEVGDINRVRTRYKLPERYFLFLGTLQPRKNIARLVAAYAQWKVAHRDDAAGLVLAGAQGWLYDPSWVQGVEGVTLTGYVDDSDRGALFAGALALVFPSLYEGFGFPVVEAMGCGTPVLASNTSSLPELVGDNGVLVDPLDEAAIAAGMSRLSDDTVLRARLASNGPAQAARFTWETGARGILAGLEATINAPV